MRKNSVYSIHPAFGMHETFLKNVKQRTGHTLEEWIRIVKKSGPPTEIARRAWLKKEHGVTLNYAYWIADQAGGKGGADHYDPDALVEAMFAGKKAALRPIYDRLLALGLSLGKDVRVSPAKTIVPFYRKHVFAQVKPATADRIDLGFALGDTRPAGPLALTGGLEKADRISHRIPISTLDDIGADVKTWFQRAYDRDA